MCDFLTKNNGWHYFILPFYIIHEVFQSEIKKIMPNYSDLQEENLLYNDFHQMA